MAIKSRFVGVRLEPAEVRKAILLSLEAGEPGNMSAGLRWALQQASMPDERQSHGGNFRPSGKRARRAAQDSNLQPPA